MKIKHAGSDDTGAGTGLGMPASNREPRSGQFLRPGDPLEASSRPRTCTNTASQKSI
jgi:hypothetical protein